MGKTTSKLTRDQIRFLEDQQVFFVATAPPQGRINLSPKGCDTLKVFSPQKIGYLDLTGSGNETRAHLIQDERITFMFCSFGPKPQIIRTYGSGKVILPNSEEWELFSKDFELLPGYRQLIIQDISSIQISCGMGVPKSKGGLLPRESLTSFWEKKSSEYHQDFLQKHNSTSLDGFPLQK
jgi:hypothetical protein